MRLKVKGRKGRQKRTWKKQVEEERVEVGMSREQAPCRLKWIVGDNLIATKMSLIQPPSRAGQSTGF